jgi:proteasome lid subunit RPN8/RPN11
MNIAIASGALAAIVDHARADAPNEACGILFGSAETIDRADRARNIAQQPDRAFEIDSAALLAAHRAARAAGRQVVGWYHSHPNGAPGPSTTDAARAVEDGKVWLIAAADVVTAWRVVPGGPVHGRFAALALIAA